MAPPASVPPVLEYAAQTDTPTAPEAIYHALQDKTPPERAAYLNIDHWGCPLCDATFDYIADTLSHVTNSETPPHDDTTSDTLTQPLEGYTADGTLVALSIQPAATDTDTGPNRVTVPAYRAPDGTAKHLPAYAPAYPDDLAPTRHPDHHDITSYFTHDQASTPPTAVQTDAITRSIPAHDLADTPKLGLDSIAGLRWICTGCGAFTADAPSVVSSHYHRLDDDAHTHDGDTPIGLLLAPTGDAYAAVVHNDDRPYVVPATSVDDLPAVQVPQHWAAIDDYPCIEPDVIDVDYWTCPYCWWTADSTAGIRSHIQGAQAGAHDGASGHYPSAPIYGYHNGDVVAVLTPAARSDPNDESHCLSLTTPDLTNPIAIAVAVLLDVRDDYASALESLGVDHDLSVDVLANAIGISSSEFRAYAADVAAIPPSLRRDTIDSDRWNDIELLLAEELAAQIDDDHVSVATIVQTPAVDATLDTADTQLVSEDAPGGRSALPDHIEASTDDAGTTHYRIDDAAYEDDPTAAVDDIPPEAELAVADLTVLESLFDVLKELAEQEFTAGGTTRGTADDQAETAAEALSILRDEIPVNRPDQPHDPENSHNEA